MTRIDSIVVGAGIIGVATAYHLATNGRRVLVLEKEERAIGASVRNLGMIWPIGQPIGQLRSLALASRDHWCSVLEDAGIWFSHCGSLHLAYSEDELNVLQEFVDLAYYSQELPRIIDAAETKRLSPPIRTDGLLGAMYSESELSVDPRTTVHKLTNYLTNEMGVEFRFGQLVEGVEPGIVRTQSQSFSCDEIYLCLGPTVGNLYPELIWGRGTKPCKLQMLRAKPKDPDYRIGTHLCAGLTSLHYSNFADCPTLPTLRSRLEREWPQQLKHHIHLLVSQHQDGTITIGDSHEYGFSLSPFSDDSIDQLMLDYLDTFLPNDGYEIIQRWQGVYPKHPTQSTLIERPDKGITVINVLSGIGMTLSFGLTELAVNAEVTI